MQVPRRTPRSLSLGSFGGMSITGLNHLTLAVSDLERSVAFYSELLGFSIRMRGPSSAYLEAGTLWLALVLDPEVRRGPLPEYSHMAFSVAPSELPLLATKLASVGATRWQEPDDSDSFYFLDPDGHKLELHSGDIHSRLAARAALREPGVVVYD
jgi:catechol 2,3-dioxygenase-like lactoylglutathione lyase family enzyme